MARLCIDAEQVRSAAALGTHPQLHELNEVIKAGLAARLDASHGLLFASHAGRVLVHALHDLTGLDALYELEGDICHELRIDREGFALDDQGDRLFTPGANRP